MLQLISSMGCFYRGLYCTYRRETTAPRQAACTADKAPPDQTRLHDVQPYHSSIWWAIGVTATRSCTNCQIQIPLCRAQQQRQVGGSSCKREKQGEIQIPTTTAFTEHILLKYKLFPETFTDFVRFSKCLRMKEMPFLVLAPQDYVQATATLY